MFFAIVDKMIKTITTEKMVFGGDCISKIDGKTVFVPYALPGEQLEVEITEEKKDYYVSKIVNILEPSPHRVKPFCPLYEKCGGCNMQHCDNEYQVELRKQILKDTFEREGIQIPEVESITGSPENYRSRFQFHNGGLMGKRTNTIIPLENCPCAVHEINEWLKETPFENRPQGRVHVFASDKITSIPKGYSKIIIAQEKEAQKDDIRNGKTIKGKRRVMRRFEGTSLNQNNICTIDLCGKKITFDVQGFFQSNIGVLEKTILKLTEGIGGKNALDMYSGAGTFSVFLADKFENVTLVEHNRDALVFAEQNLVGTKHESFGVSGEKWVLEHEKSCVSRNGTFDVAIIDPPRTGMEKEVCKYLCSSNIPKIRSVSCDSATHARDAKYLIRAGYKLQKLYLLDFYPQTCHIESLAFFEKG